MSQQISKIAERLNEIEKQRRNLDVEAAMLRKWQRAFVQFPQLINEADVLNERNALKFEMLARIASFLSTPDNYIYGGSTTKEIYQAVVEGVAADNEEKEAFNRSVARNEDGKPKDLGTPMMNAKSDLNYNTFRSYMQRFKNEDRLFYDEERSRWRVTRHVVTLPTMKEEEYEPDRL